MTRFKRMFRPGRLYLILRRYTTYRSIYTLACFILYEMESVPKLSTPEEEIAYLRERIAEKEAELAGSGAPEREQVIAEHLHAHHTAPEDLLAPEYRISEATKVSEAEAILTDLNTNGSEQAIRSLQKTMDEKGIKNALAVLEKIGDPHVADEVHRYLRG